MIADHDRGPECRFWAGSLGFRVGSGFVSVLAFLVLQHVLRTCSGGRNTLQNPVSASSCSRLQSPSTSL